MMNWIYLGILACVLATITYIGVQSIRIDKLSSDLKNTQNELIVKKAKINVDTFEKMNLQHKVILLKNIGDANEHTEVNTSIGSHILSI